MKVGRTALKRFFVIVLIGAAIAPFVVAQAPEAPRPPLRRHLSTMECAVLFAPQPLIRAIDSVTRWLGASRVAYDQQQINSVLDALPIEKDRQEAIAEIASRVNIAKLSDTQLVELMTRLSLRSNDEVWLFAGLLARRLSPGLDGHLALKSKLREFDPMKLILALLRREGKSFLEHGSIEIPRFEENSTSVKEAARRAFQLDRAALEEAVKGLKRSEESGTHTLDVGSHVSGQFQRVLLDFLVTRPELPIQVFEGQVDDTLPALSAAGYTELRPLPAPETSHFEAYFALNPQTGKASFVALTRPGKSYRVDAAANLLYFGKAAPGGLAHIQPARIRIHRHSGSPRMEFAASMQQAAVNPDVVMLTDTATLREALERKGLRPEKPLLVGGADALLYSLQGKQVLVVTSGPEFFGDRAGELVHALSLLESQGRKRSIVVFNQARSLGSGLAIGEYVAPTGFSLQNHTEAETVDGVPNLAEKLTIQGFSWSNPLRYRRGSPAVSIDSPLFQDRGWLQSRQAAGTTAVVESESYWVARAVRETGGELFVMHQIVDQVGSAPPKVPSFLDAFQRKLTGELQVALLNFALRPRPAVASK